MLIYTSSEVLYHGKVLELIIKKINMRELWKRNFLLPLNNFAKAFLKNLLHI